MVSGVYMYGTGGDGGGDPKFQLEKYGKYLLLLESL